MAESGRNIAADHRVGCAMKEAFRSGAPIKTETTASHIATAGAAKPIKVQFGRLGTRRCPTSSEAGMRGCHIDMTDRTSPIAASHDGAIRAVTRNVPVERSLAITRDSRTGALAGVLGPWVDTGTPPSH